MSKILRAASLGLALHFIPSAHAQTDDGDRSCDFWKKSASLSQSFLIEMKPAPQCKREAVKEQFEDRADNAEEIEEKEIGNEEFRECLSSASGVSEFRELLVKGIKRAEEAQRTLGCDGFTLSNGNPSSVKKILPAVNSIQGRCGLSEPSGP